jgi:N-acetylmuramoyl-L-alanine amidase
MNFDYNTEEVTSTPASGKVIVLDAGHGTPDEGDCLLTLIEK